MKDFDISNKLVRFYSSYFFYSFIILSQLFPVNIAEFLKTSILKNSCFCFCFLANIIDIITKVLISEQVLLTNIRPKKIH